MHFQLEGSSTIARSGG